MTVDDNDLIEIPIDEIALEIDETGMPKAVPGAKTATGRPIESEGEPQTQRTKPDPRLAALEKERDEAKAERDRHAREAATERSRATAAEEASARKDEALSKRTGEAVGAHRARVASDYQRVAREHETVVSGISQANSMLAQAERDLEAAHTAGDAARIASLTAHVGKITGQLTQLEALKPNVESYLNEAKQTYEDTERQVAEASRKKADPAPEPEAKGPKNWNDFVDNYSDDWIDRSPRATQSWLRDNKEALLKDSKTFAKLDLFAREYALDHGESALDSKDFVAALDAKFIPKPKVEVEEEESDVTDDNQEVAEKPQAKKSMAAAPVSRNASPARPQGGGAGSIKLTREQYAHAPELYSSVEDFDPEVRQRFPIWTPDAARYQYDVHQKRAHKEQKHLKIQ